MFPNYEGSFLPSSGKHCSVQVDNYTKQLFVVDKKEALKCQLKCDRNEEMI